MKIGIKQLSLFYDEEIEIVPVKKSRNIFEDYDGFVEKFKPKKTTDDCFTPPDVYDCVLRYVSEKTDMGDLDVIRPFYPGGDYTKIDYPDRCVVIDNPPFSIVSKIARYYIERGIKFFLFAPHLTLFSANIDCTAIVCGAEVIYENGAKVRTSFLSNMLGNIRIMGEPALYEDLIRIVAGNSKKIKFPKYSYPLNILTVSMVQKMVECGIPVQFDSREVYHYKTLDSQSKCNKSIFGCGFLLSEKAAAEKAAAKKAIEKAVEEKKKLIEWTLSEREMNIIKSLENTLHNNR
jgi:hypothetical protein